MKEKKARVEDALNATVRPSRRDRPAARGAAALHPGAGRAEARGDQAVGVSIVKRALEEPIRQIVVNAGSRAR